MANKVQAQFLAVTETEQPPWDELCAVAPSPELQARLSQRFNEITSALERAAETPPTAARGRRGAARAAAPAGDELDVLLKRKLHVRRQPAHPGFNDGLIIPGTYYPLGTPLRVVRRAAADRAPLSGTVRVIVVLVNFKDVKFTAAHTRQHFQELFFSAGVLPHGSVREYFTEATNGKVTIAGDVVGPFNLSQKMSFYAHGDSGIGAAQPNARTMAQEAAQLANSSVNFAPFDNDGNGFVDAFIVIHAGRGAEQTGSVNDIWSHKWVLPAEFNADGTKIFAYLTVPEDSRIGVCCHELGHLLFGFPDLYDTDDSSEGVGNWCLMGGGSWNTVPGAQSGDVPAHPSAWCKVNQGWVSVTAPANNGNATIREVKTSHNVFRLWKNGAGGQEYFLVENRQRTQYDQGLPGDGLLVWHIDESISENSNEAHPKVKLMQADGLNQLESAANRGDTGDPFPGSSNKTSFSNTSTPNSKSYAGANTCVGVTSISPSAPVMTARLNVRCFVKPLKETKEGKELSKELQPEKRIKDIIDSKPVLSDKQFAKEVKEKEFKEFKEIEKPITDKATGFDKPIDKPGEKLTDGGGLGGLGGGGLGRSRERGGTPEPFIGAELRPDLSGSALLGEGDVDEVQAQMEMGSAEAKRLFDSKSPEV